MKILSRIIMLTITISLLFIASNNMFNNASAESYESSVGISFTLNPTINVTVSGDLTIPNLTPGDYKDSNSITVTANSNSIAGYTLSSTVGSSTNTSTELRKDGVDTTNKFSSITTNKASLSNFDDSTNTWGYSYSTDSGSTWISGDITGTTNTGYNGLPLYTSTNPIKLINSTTSGSSSVLFKIGARTTTNQIAGEYTNVINFIGVANPNPPIVYMQNATLADCGKDMVDSRDNNVYGTTLLSNGQCWMTKNLDLAGGTQLTSDDTNMASDWVMPTANGFQINNRLPNSETITSGTSLPSTAFSDNSTAYVFNSNSATCGSLPCYSYYSWTTATLGSGLNISTDNTDAPYDICPKGWHLPNTRGGTDSTSDFRALMIALGGSAIISDYDNSTEPTGSSMYNKLVALPINFSSTGTYDKGEFYDSGWSSRYWSSTSAYTTGAHARYLYFTSNRVNSYDINARRNGNAIRCVKSS